MKLCKRTLIKNPVAEAPVNIKNFFNFPVIFSFTVKNINTIPNKKKTRNGNKNKIEPLKNSLTTGTQNSLTITKKTVTNAQNVDIRYLFIKFYA